MASTIPRSLLGFLLLNVACLEPRGLANASLLPGIADTSNISHVLNTTSLTHFDVAGAPSSDVPHGGIGWFDDDDSHPPSPSFHPSFEGDSRLFNDAMDQIAALLEFSAEPLNLWNLATTLFLAENAEDSYFASLYAIARRVYHAWTRFSTI